MKPFVFLILLLILTMLACSLSFPLESGGEGGPLSPTGEGDRAKGAPASVPPDIPTVTVSYPIAPLNLLPQNTTPPDRRGNSLNPTQAGVTYCTMNGVELKMDLYYPPSGADSLLPVTVYVHGGGWSSGDKRDGAGALEIPVLQQAGFLVAAVNYRLAPQYLFPTMIEDVKCAIRSLRAHADEYNLDPNRIGAWGGSAGGHLVALLGTSDESAGFDVGEYLEYSSRLQAVVDMFGPADFAVPFAGGYKKAASVFRGFDVALASPITYITADDPPFLILHGDLDRLVPLDQSQRLLAALQTAGVPAELVVVKNAGHGFKPMNGQISPSRREIMQKVVQFFEEILK
ncbi:MAG: alpha/beta hydrolase [Anaerolineales bacterium]|nr:alpha/beta hydrolase [Anaerolineales bacterium]